MTQTKAISELFAEPERLVDLIVPALKGNVSIDKKTLEPFLSSVDLMKEKTRIKALWYLLGKKAVELSSERVDGDQVGVSAIKLADALRITKGQSDGAVNALKQEGMITVFAKRGKEVLYHIPDHMVTSAMEVVQGEKSKKSP